MLGKIAILLFVATICRAELSAVSSQSVIHHASPLRHSQPSHGYAHQPQQLHGYPPAGPPQHIYQAYAPGPSKGHAVSSQSFVSHQSPSKPSYSYGGPSGLHGQSGGGHYQEEYGHPAYEFKYSVSDPHTGDQKSQFESRDGDSTKGEYSLLQPDGKVRTVVYHVDKHSGFNAQVSYSHPKSHAGY